MSRNDRYEAALQALGYSFDGPLKIGGDYVPVLHLGDQVYISGQIPRVNDTVVFPGRVGEDVSLAEAQTAAKISTLRCLKLLSESLGSLDAVKGIARINVSCSRRQTSPSRAKSPTQLRRFSIKCWAKPAPMCVHRWASISCRRMRR